MYVVLYLIKMFFQKVEIEDLYSKMNANIIFDNLFDSIFVR